MAVNTNDDHDVFVRNRGVTDLVWGLNAVGGIFIREGGRESDPGCGEWMRVRGRLAQVTAGVAEVWRVNVTDGIVPRVGPSGMTVTGTDWIRCPGGLAQVSIGTAEILGTSTTTGLADSDKIDGSISSL
ncbi:MAG: tectonin domain-containing protein [Candidatus Brocadiia bacterium]